MRALVKIDRLEPKDIDNLRRGRWVARFAFRPNTAERIQNLRTVYPS